MSIQLILKEMHLERSDNEEIARIKTNILTEFYDGDSFNVDSHIQAGEIFTQIRKNQERIKMIDKNIQNMLKFN